MLKKSYRLIKGKDITSIDLFREIQICPPFLFGYTPSRKKWVSHYITESGSVITVYCEFYRITAIIIERPADKPIIFIPDESYLKLLEHSIPTDGVVYKTEFSRLIYCLLTRLGSNEIIDFVEENITDFHIPWVEYKDSTWFAYLGVNDDIYLVTKRDNITGMLFSFTDGSFYGSKDVSTADIELIHYIDPVITDMEVETR